MLEDVQWTVGTRGGPIAEEDRIEHIPTIEAPADGSGGEVARQWNLMVETLLKHGLMKKK